MSKPQNNLANFLTIFEKSRQADVAAAIKQVFLDSQITEISPLSGGYSTSTLYKLLIGNQHYVMRVMGLDHTLTDRQQQINCLKEAANLGIAPQCQYANANSGIIIMSYIAAQPLEFSPEKLSLLAEIMRNLHKSPLFGPPHMPLSDYLYDIERSLLAYPIANRLIKYFANIHSICDVLSEHYIAASCHNDLNANNLLFDGTKLFLLDWEAAGESDPYFDLATVCNQLIVEPNNERYFLLQYFKQPLTAYQSAKIYLMKQISAYYYALHFLSFAAENGMDLRDISLFEHVPTLKAWTTKYKSGELTLNSAQDYFLYALVYIKQSEEQINSDDFKLACNELKFNGNCALPS